MSQTRAQEAQHHLTRARVQNRTDALLVPFLNACESNDSALALQLAPGRDDGTLTFGLNKAVGATHLDLARQLLAVGAKWDSETVHCASKSLDATKILVESGFDVNTGLVAGATLLLMVIRRNDEPFTRYVLEHGANPNLGPPLIQEGIIAYIRPVHNSGWVLNMAAAFCTPEIFALLLSHGADISNAIPLHYAVNVPLHEIPESRIPMLDYLLGLGLDINALDDAIKISDHGNGQYGTPLHYAVLWGRTDEAKWMLKRGADPDKKSQSGNSVRDDLKRKSNKDDIKILLRMI